jgi:hypothetical protein
VWLERDQEAESWYRDGLRSAQERDIRTRLLAALGTLTQDPGERTALLTEAVELRGNLVAAAAAQLALHALDDERSLH